jgi:hypothetical protein
MIVYVARTYTYVYDGYGMSRADRMIWYIGVIPVPPATIPRDAAAFGEYCGAVRRLVR